MDDIKSLVHHYRCFVTKFSENLHGFILNKSKCNCNRFFLTNIVSMYPLKIIGETAVYKAFQSTKNRKSIVKINFRFTFILIFRFKPIQMTN